MTFRTWLSASKTRSAARLARPLGATLLLGVLLLGLSMVDGTVPVAHAQKGGGGNPPPAPVLPTVRYGLQWIDGGPGWAITSPRDIKQAGDFVGYAQDALLGTVFSAFACPDGGTPINLNDLDADWWDLNAPAPTSVEGWWAAGAYGINDGGGTDADPLLIIGFATVGSAESANPSHPTRAFVLVNAFGPAPYFLLLPTVGAGNQFGKRINNSGQAVGVTGAGAIRYLPLANWPISLDDWPVYRADLAIRDAGINGPGAADINDAGDIVAITWPKAPSPSGSWRQSGTTGATAFFAGHEFPRVNNATPALISGSRGKSGGLVGGAFRLPVTAQTGSAAQIIFPGDLSNYARAINDDGDTVVHANGRGFLYTDAISPRTNTRYGTSGNGILPLDSLVWNPDARWLNAPFLRLDGSNNRVDPDHPDTAGFGQICGRAQGNGYDRGFLLTPFLP
jgi:hypothetical protein